MMLTDWNLSRVRRSLLTIMVTLGLGAAIFHQHGMAVTWTVAGLLAIYLLLVLIEALARPRAAADKESVSP